MLDTSSTCAGVASEVGDRYYSYQKKSYNSYFIKFQIDARTPNMRTLGIVRSWTSSDNFDSGGKELGGRQPRKGPDTVEVNQHYDQSDKFLVDYVLE